VFGTLLRDETQYVVWDLLIFKLPQGCRRLLVVSRDLRDIRHAVYLRGAKSAGFLAVVDVADSCMTFCESGANGFGRPTGSGVICVVKSLNVLNNGSVKIVPLKFTVRSVRSVLTRSSPGAFPDVVVVASEEVVAGAELESSPYHAARTITTTATTLRILCCEMRSNIRLTEPIGTDSHGIRIGRISTLSRNRY